jgi:hypothetical protein
MNITSFKFNEEAQTIEVVYITEESIALFGNNTMVIPGSARKDVYGIKDGKLSFLRNIEGKVVKEHVEEQIIFNE